MTVAGHWGILFEGEFARTLWLETDQGYVEVRSTVDPLDKFELLKIAESLPASDS